jgi:predicted nuclease of predicted toxin-antitoxin system
MRFLVDAQLSPAIAAWINREFSDHSASSIRSHGLSSAEDAEVIETAKELGAVLITKDFDFVRLQALRGSPPQIVWVTCGNTSNEVMRSILRTQLTTIVDLLSKGEDLVELSG